ncbi:MAG TPA: SpoIIE family protein phosphatase [Clostridiaceae bacterium]|nr:SpoIIE family protein phosphatase [Clostridiaceae bacterium]
MAAENDNIIKDSNEKGLSDQCSFIKCIIDGMYDWVRVLDRDNNIIYMNKAMADGLGGYPIGKKCYNVLGREEPCENCISRQTVFEGHPHEKEEIINERIFSVMSSPVKDEDGNIVAVVEVLRDVTQMKQLHSKILQQNKKLKSDLNIARKLQCSLLPKELLKDKIDFAFLYKPCEALGGDFLDIFEVDSNHIGIYIADVSGHGVSASMLTIFLRSSIDKGTLSPAEALEKLYKDFNTQGFAKDLYITVFYAIINLKNGKMVYSNAGHNVSPIVFNKEKFEVLRVPGLPISNWVESAEYTNISTTLQKGDRLFLYTDGIIELKNKSNEQFGEERLLKILLNDFSVPSIVLNRIVESACNFADIEDSSSIADDITVALLEIK